MILSVSLSRVRPSWEKAGRMKGMTGKPFFSLYLLRVQCNTLGIAAFLFFAPCLLPPWWDTYSQPSSAKEHSGTHLQGSTEWAVDSPCPEDQLASELLVLRQWGRDCLCSHVFMGHRLSRSHTWPWSCPCLQGMITAIFVESRKPGVGREEVLILL